jgi:ATP-dependent Clp protease adaptor protein ClpS
MAGDPKKREDGGVEVVVRPVPKTKTNTKPKPKTERVRRFQVVFHNDDYTTKWFVVEVLTRFFHMTEETATAFMLTVHTFGQAVAGVYTRDVAETKVGEVEDYAREMGMPLRLTIEPEDEAEAS